jgi:hypothetical protein
MKTNNKTVKATGKIQIMSCHSGKKIKSKDIFPMNKQLASISIAAFSLFLLLLPSPAKSESNLIYVTNGEDDSKYYLNRKWLKSKGDGIVTFVYTKQLKEPDSDGILFIDITAIGSCKSKRYGMTEIQLYNVNDKMVAQKDIDLKLETAKPESVMDALLDATCRILEVP